MKLNELIRWSESEFTDLPWRKDRSLYRTLVSEIMLQQTTVGTVKNHYERFLKSFPTLTSLAQASESELLVAWKGLGYYRRARNLKKIAEAIVVLKKFPEDKEALQEIPGIGPYTASALTAIGRDKKSLAVDANLERVIARLYGLKLSKGPKLQKEIQTLFDEGKVFPAFKGSYRSLNEALMDLGRTYCQSRKASCELCPLKTNCLAFQSGDPTQFPIMLEMRKSQEHELHLLRIYVRKKDKLLVYKKEEKEWLSGQFEVPTFILKTSDATLKQYPVMKKKITSELSFKSGITKYKITNSLIEMNESEFKELNFKRPIEWRDIKAEESNFTTTTIKGLTKLN